MKDSKASLIAQLQRINEYGIFVDKKSVTSSFPLHWHDCWELEIVIGGSGRQSLNGVEYPLSRGSVYLLNPTDFHSVESNGLVIYSIMFSDDEVPEELVGAFLKYTSGFCASVSEEKLQQLERICELIMLECSHGLPMSRAAVKNLTQYFFVLLLRLFDVDVPKSAVQKKSPVAEAVMYLNMHFRENPSLTDTAAYVKISTNYLSEQFRAVTGKTYKQYITDLKLNYAKKLLLSSGIAVTEVCFACGFASVSNFLRVFKDKFGVSPQNMRRGK